MIKGETVFTGARHPGTELRILCTCAYYLGFLDKDGFPYSRETRYFATKEEAEKALALFHKTPSEQKDSLEFWRK
jgi:hypothetical protein